MIQQKLTAFFGHTENLTKLHTDNVSDELRLPAGVTLVWLRLLLISPLLLNSEP